MDHMLGYKIHSGPENLKKSKPKKLVKLISWNFYRVKKE